MRLGHVMRYTINCSRVRLAVSISTFTNREISIWSPRKPFKLNIFKVSDYIHHFLMNYFLYAFYMCDAWGGSVFLRAGVCSTSVVNRDREGHSAGRRLVSSPAALPFLLLVMTSSGVASVECKCWPIETWKDVVVAGVPVRPAARGPCI